MEKILLILDLDETLIYATDKVLDQKADFEVFEYKVYKRPFLDCFFTAIKEDFLIAIWSSAGEEYIQEIVKRIIPKEITLEFVWGRNRCTYRRDLRINESGYYDDDLNDHYHYSKPLKKLKKRGYQLEKILIVDDSPHKVSDNYGNAIYPTAFMGDFEDQELKLLARYLKTLKTEDNVRIIEKRNWQNKFK